VDPGRGWLQDRVDDTVGELLHQEFTTGGNGRVTVRQHGEFRVRCAVCGVLTHEAHYAESHQARCW